ncbi:hypothetical protein [Abyssisolibacter fermentans]|uniref:hypothetical protein n=1 Tax=Abyssisolibacter fermentans TaxID=1766203 RepID=UPI00082F935F|nr:hypothetical protein [Abyssisolibacter fermentans]
MGYWVEKVNTSPKQKKIKVALEKLGHTNVEVWWENISSAPIMCGPEGGFSFHSDQETICGLGYSYKEAMEAIETWEWLKVIK